MCHILTPSSNRNDDLMIFIGPIKSETCLLKLYSLQPHCVPYPHHLLQDFAEEQGPTSGTWHHKKGNKSKSNTMLKTDYESVYQRVRAHTNLLTAQQSMNLILIVVLTGTTHIFMNIFAPQMNLKMSPLTRYVLLL
jgi:hypothetical protein